MNYKLQRMKIDLKEMEYEYWLPDNCIVVCVKVLEYIKADYMHGEEEVERVTYLYYLEPIDVS